MPRFEMENWGGFGLKCRDDLERCKDFTILELPGVVEARATSWNCRTFPEARMKQLWTASAPETSHIY